MKKILPLFLAVLLVVALSFPTYATDGYTVSGVWTFNEYLEHPNPNGNTKISIVFISNGTTYSDLAVNTSAQYNMNKLIYGGVITVYDFNTGAWINEAFRVIEFTTPVLLSKSEYEWFIANATPPTCDGSACPATDLNKDNFCDDCGFEFAVPRDYSPFTVKKFMNHIGQIFSSAVSWVSDVGAAILAQPLLLAFTALPLCGLGIAVFRRLKETV